MIICALAVLQIQAWQIEPGIYTFDSLANQISSKESRVTASPTLKNRLCVIALKAHDPAKTREIISMTLGVRFREDSGQTILEPDPIVQSDEQKLYQSLTTKINTTWSAVFKKADPFIRNYSIPPDMDLIQDAIDAAVRTADKSAPRYRNLRHSLWSAQIPWTDKAGIAAARGLLKSDYDEMQMSGPLYYTVHQTPSARLLSNDQIIQGDGYFWRDTSQWPNFVNWYAVATIRGFESDLSRLDLPTDEKQRRLDARARDTYVTHRIHLEPLDLSMHFEFSITFDILKGQSGWYGGSIVPALGMPVDEAWIREIYQGAGLGTSFDKSVTATKAVIPMLKSKYRWKGRGQNESLALSLIDCAKATSQEIIAPFSTIRDTAWSSSAPSGEGIDAITPLLGQGEFRSRTLSLLSRSEAPATAVANLPTYDAEIVDGVLILRNAFEFLDRKYEPIGIEKWLAFIKQPLTYASAEEFAKGLTRMELSKLGRMHAMIGMPNVARSAAVLRLLSAIKPAQRETMLNLPHQKSMLIDSKQIPTTALINFASDVKELGKTALASGITVNASLHTIYRPDYLQMLKDSWISVFALRDGKRVTYNVTILPKVPDTGDTDSRLDRSPPLALYTQYIGPFQTTVQKKQPH